MDLEKASERHLMAASEAILRAILARPRTGDLVGDAETYARAALVAVRLPQIALALDDAVKLIRAWHGMEMSKGNEEQAWKLYAENAPEMRSIMLALKIARGEEPGE